MYFLKKYTLSSKSFLPPQSLLVLTVEKVETPKKIFSKQVGNQVFLTILLILCDYLFDLFSIYFTFLYSVFFVLQYELCWCCVSSSCAVQLLSSLFYTLLSIYVLQYELCWCCVWAEQWNWCQQQLCWSCWRWRQPQYRSQWQLRQLSHRNLYIHYTHHHLIVRDKGFLIMSHLIFKRYI